MKLGHLRAALLGTLGFLMFPFSNFGQDLLIDMHANGLECIKKEGNQKKIVALSEATKGTDLLNSRRNETNTAQAAEGPQLKTAIKKTPASRLSIGWFEPVERPAMMVLNHAPREMEMDQNQDFKRDADYFKDFLKFYFQTREISRKGYSESSLDLIATKQALEENFSKNGKPGLVLAINGGHVLSNSVYLENGLTATPGYEDLVLQNILRIKGEKPLIDHTREIIRHPIFAIAPASIFENGLCGSDFNLGELANLFPKNLKKQISLNTGITPLGYKAIKELLNLEQGNRVLIDVRGMSLQSRKDYYSWLKNEKEEGAGVPILASSCAISGLDWSDPEYIERRGKIKSKILNHYTSSLSKNDIIEIYHSGGLIGISLDRRVIFDSDLVLNLEMAKNNSRQEMGLYVRGFLANVFTVIHSIGEKQAWDIVSIGTGYNPIAGIDELFESREEFLAFRHALKNYIEYPESIPGLFTAEELKSLMFGLSANEITDKLFSGNAYEFLKTHLPEEQFATKFEIFSTNRP